MNLKELPHDVIEAMLDTLPVDISFVDKEDKVKYFNTPKDGRNFPRTKMDLQRKVQNCHPPQSLDKVNAILEGFKNGTRESAEFWIEMGGKFIYINYYPVRDVEGNYLGTMEFMMDATHVRDLTGENRLLDE